MFKTCKKPPMSIISVSGSICTFNALQSGIPLKSHTVALTATQSGSGTPSPDNPRPITGYSAINIGNSIAYDTNIEQGTLDSRGLNANATNRIRTADYIPVVSGHTYKITLIGSGAYYLGVSGYTANDYTTARTQSTAWLGNNTDLLIDAGVNYIRINVRFASSTDITPADLTGILVTDITNYHTIQIGSTVYGGEYDARTGVLTVTHGILDLGLLSWTVTSWGAYRATAPVDAYRPPAVIIPDSIAEKYSITSYIELNSNKPNDFYAFGSGNIYVMSDSGTPTGDVLYELATPQTIQLSPCPIDVLEGQNNIFSDVGSTALEAIKIGR